MSYIMQIDAIGTRELPEFLKNSSGGTIENSIDDITFGEGYLKNSKVKIRHSYFPFSSSIIAEIECGKCDNKYKKKLFYQRVHYFSTDLELRCPSCKDIISISYEKVETD